MRPGPETLLWLGGLRPHTGVRTHFQGQETKKRPKDSSSEVLEWGGQELGIGDPATSPTSSQVSLMVAWDALRQLTNADKEYFRQ